MQIRPLTGAPRKFLFLFSAMVEMDNIDCISGHVAQYPLGVCSYVPINSGGKSLSDASSKHLMLLVYHYMNHFRTFRASLSYLSF